MMKEGIGGSYSDYGKRKMVKSKDQVATCLINRQDYQFRKEFIPLRIDRTRDYSTNMNN